MKGKQYNKSKGKKMKRKNKRKQKEQKRTNTRLYNREECSQRNEDKKEG
jgi:hypothetical protein